MLIHAHSVDHNTMAGHGSLADAIWGAHGYNAPRRAPGRGQELRQEQARLRRKQRQLQRRARGAVFARRKPRKPRQPRQPRQPRPKAAQAPYVVVDATGAVPAAEPPAHITGDLLRQVMFDPDARPNWTYQVALIHSGGTGVPVFRMPERWAEPISDMTSHAGGEVAVAAPAGASSFVTPRVLRNSAARAAAARLASAGRRQAAAVQRKMKLAIRRAQAAEKKAVRTAKRKAARELEAARRAVERKAEQEERAAKRAATRARKSRAAALRTSTQRLKKLAKARVHLAVLEAKMALREQRLQEAAEDEAQERNPDKVSAEFAMERFIISRRQQMYRAKRAVQQEQFRSQDVMAELTPHQKAMFEEKVELDIKKRVAALKKPQQVWRWPKQANQSQPQATPALDDDDDEDDDDYDDTDAVEEEEDDDDYASGSEDGNGDDDDVAARAQALFGSSDSDSDSGMDSDSGISSSVWDIDGGATTRSQMPIVLLFKDVVIRGPFIPYQTTRRGKSQTQYPIVLGQAHETQLQAMQLGESASAAVETMILMQVGQDKDGVVWSVSPNRGKARVAATEGNDLIFQELRSSGNKRVIANLRLFGREMQQKTCIDGDGQPEDLDPGMRLDRNICRPWTFADLLQRNRPTERGGSLNILPVRVWRAVLWQFCVRFIIDGGSATPANVFVSADATGTRFPTTVEATAVRYGGRRNLPKAATRGGARPLPKTVILCLMPGQGAAPSLLGDDSKKAKSKTTGGRAPLQVGPMAVAITMLIQLARTLIADLDKLSPSNGTEAARRLTHLRGLLAHGQKWGGSSNWPKRAGRKR